MSLLSAALVFVAASANAGVAATASRDPRPNVVLIVTDNLGYADLGCYGARDIYTPRIDRLASEGVRFTQFYSNAPDCSPARTALLTGRYQHRIGGLECAIGIGGVGRYDEAIRLGEQHNLGLPAREPTIARLLKQAGYETAGFGKWHLGYEPKFLPRVHGFDYFLGLMSGCTDYFYHHDPSGAAGLFENDRPVLRDGYTTDLFTAGAVEFVRQAAGRHPFFLYLPYNAPSAPYIDPRRKPNAPLAPGAWDSPPWHHGDRPTLKAMIERLDQGVGAVLDALEAERVADNTLVIFVNDNGSYGVPGSNAPWRGFAHELYEGGIRVACIVRWPGRLKAGQVSNRVGMLFDLTRSIAAATGVSPPADRPFDGIDLLGELAEGSSPRPRTLYWRARRGELTWRAVRHRDLKYIALDAPDQRDEHLYDIAGDPAETNNLAAKRPDAVAQLKQLLAAWEDEVRVRPF